MKKRSLMAVYTGLILGLTSSLRATTYYVDASNGGTANGNSFATAWPDLQTALAAASSVGDIILTAQGTYKPHSSNATVSFVLRNGVLVKGGYRGGSGIDAGDRDIANFETILTGDLASNDTSCTDVTHLGDNSEHVVVANSNISNSGTLLEGFTITHGVADRTLGAPFQDDGGGLLNNSSTSYTINQCKFACNRSIISGGAVANLSSFGPIFTNCRFDFNASVERGGAVAQEASTAVFNNCIFTHNAISDGVGGALYAFGADNVSCSNCQFEYNTADVGGAVFAEGISVSAEYQDCAFSYNGATGVGGAIDHEEVAVTDIIGGGFDHNSGEAGGAIFSDSSSSEQLLRIENTPFTANTAFGGEFLDGPGGAIRNIGPELTARGCVFSSNEAASNGAAIYNSTYSPKIVDCQFLANIAGEGNGGAVYAQQATLLSLINDRFVANEGAADYHGGAIYCVGGGDVEAVNCLFAGHTTAYDGGAVYITAGSSTWINCTVADNIAENVAGGIYSGGDCTLQNCILWNNSDGGGISISSQVTVIGRDDITYTDIGKGDLEDAGDTNMSVDPVFVDVAAVDPRARNYRLRLCAAVIDQGSKTNVPLDTEDLDNDTSDPDQLTPDLDKRARAADDSEIPDVDIDGESAPFPDMGAYEWQAPTCAIMGDVNDDTYVNGLDISAFVYCLTSRLATHCDCGDANRDGVTDVNDTFCFVGLLLGSDCCGTCGAESCVLDCNGNGISDDYDILYDTSEDCNNNFHPDECDIANMTSDDINENDIPDECDVAFHGEGEPSEYEGMSEIERWVIFFDWSIEQCWGSECEATIPEQTQAILDKLNELSLSVEGLGD